MKYRIVSKDFGSENWRVVARGTFADMAEFYRSSLFAERMRAMVDENGEVIYSFEQKTF